MGNQDSSNKVGKKEMQEKLTTRGTLIPPRMVKFCSAIIFQNCKKIYAAEKSSKFFHKYEYMHICIIFYVTVSNDVVQYCQPWSIISLLVPSCSL